LAVFASVGLAQNWQQRNTVAAPTARNGHGMSHDFGRGISVLFGGYQGTNVARGDTWEWNGFGWAQRNVSVAPPARWAHGMAYDLRSSQTILFGGYVPATGFANDTWTWNGNTWQQLSLAVAPTPRSYFGMAYDSIRGRVVLFGVLDVTFLEEIITDIERREPLLVSEGGLAKHLCLPSLLHHARFMHARVEEDYLAWGATLSSSRDSCHAHSVSQPKCSNPILAAKK
jgi:hypothetical protein